MVPWAIEATDIENPHMGDVILAWGWGEGKGNFPLRIWDLSSSRRDYVEAGGESWPARVLGCRARGGCPLRIAARRAPMKEQGDCGFRIERRTRSTLPARRDRSGQAAKDSRRDPRSDPLPSTVLGASRASKSGGGTTHWRTSRQWHPALNGERHPPAVRGARRGTSRGARYSRRRRPGRGRRWTGLRGRVGGCPCR